MCCNLGINPDSFNPRVLYTFRKKFNAGSKIACHSHDFASIVYILSGSCTYNIDSLPYQVRKGDVIVLNPGVSHEKKFAQGEEIVEFHSGFNNICIKNLPKDCLTAPGSCPVLTLSQYEQDLYKCCREILSEQENKEPGCELMIKSLFMKLIVLLLKGTHANEAAGESGGVTFESYERGNIVNTIISFINDNYTKDISLDRISRNLYLSPVYISKVFKEEAGESPINYLIKYRLAKARDMLEEGSLPVKAVAKSVGYHDAYHFSKLFKKYYGYPPSKYKLK